MDDVTAAQKAHGARDRQPACAHRAARCLRIAAVVVLCFVHDAAAQEDIPPLTTTVNDFANVIDAASEQQLDTLIRSLQQASGDVVVVATVKTFQPYGDIREYAVKMFENQGRGIGQRDKDNGLLVLLAVDDRAVWTEVGYDLEGFITDGYAGETARQYMIPEFRNGQYGAGLVAGVTRLVARIAQEREVTLQGVRVEPRRPRRNVGSGGSLLMALFVLFLILNGMRGGGRRRRGWYSGIGPFGGGFGGGGFGGGFGGFGGGRSGGGGGGGSW